MKLPFPSRQPSVLHSSPLWLLACSTGLSQVCFGAGKAALDKHKIRKVLTKQENHCLPHTLSCLTDMSS